ncbi:MAG: HNH endonuclease [Chitinispirillaceae bacterium]|nr:HNH endonuclease [Chitinispirillaceae bacterium]
MPPRYVKTIGDEINYEYAKLISKSAFGSKINYRFVTDRYKALCSGEISISSTMREWEKDLTKECAFCGKTGDLTTTHLIPINRGGTDDPDNLVLCCAFCNASRGDKGVFEWLGLKKKDSLHWLVAGKYLKELHRLHEARGTVSVSITELETLCKTCRNSAICSLWGKTESLSSFCLESIL